MCACAYVCTYNVICVYTYICTYVYIYFCLYLPMYVHVFMSSSIRRQQRQFGQIRKSFKQLPIQKDFGVKRSISAVMMCVCVCVCVRAGRCEN